MIVGAGEIGQLVARKFEQHPEYGIDLVGLVDETPLDLRPDIRARVIGATADTPRSSTPSALERVVVAFSEAPTEEMIDVVRALKRAQVQVDIVPPLLRRARTGHARAFG